jgi:hypothetical protein
MVRVDSDLVLTGAQPRYAVVEVLEAHREVAKIAPRRLEPETSAPEDTRGHQRQTFESDERRLLGGSSNVTSRRTNTGIPYVP